MVRADALKADIVDVAGAELGIQHRHVRNVLDHQPLKIRPVAVIVGIGRQRDVVAGNALDPLERTGSDRLVVERRCVRICFLLEDVLGHEEGPGQDRLIGRIGLLHPPRQFGRADDLDILDQFVPGAAAGAEIRVVDQLDVELDVLGGERRPVMPFGVVREA